MDGVKLLIHVHCIEFYCLRWDHFFLCFILYEITLTGDRFTPLMGPITHPRHSKILHAVIFDVNVSETSFNTTSL